MEMVLAGGLLEAPAAEELMQELLDGRMQTSEIVQLLTALNTRPYRAEELTGFARAMRRNATQVFGEKEELPAGMVDTCGTGGDDAGTFNISTAAAIVAAAAGARVAKHGNRAASSKCGSADVLEALGVRLDLPFPEIGRGVREIGIGFLFAQAAHTAARHAMPARREIGVRTVFNLLGPLTNPARAQAQVVGVFSRDVMKVVAETLMALGVERAFVVHGAGKLDEISVAGPTEMIEVRPGELRESVISPLEFGIAERPLAAIRGGSIQDNAATILGLFRGEERGEEGKARHDIVVLNAAAALVAAGAASDFHGGIEGATRAIASGGAMAKLEALRAYPEP
jgi:anthranilate phosphoribosyltransferase